MNISGHFTKEEFEFSELALRSGIVNTMSETETRKATNLCKDVLEKVREHFGLPIKVNSGFRCSELNDITPGSSDTSQHTLGEAADITIEGIPLLDIFEFIQNNLEFDQLILEYNSWIHVSYIKCRKETLRKDTGTEYIPFKV